MSAGKATAALSADVRWAAEGARALVANLAILLELRVSADPETECTTDQAFAGSVVLAGSDLAHDLFGVRRAT